MKTGRSTRKFNRPQSASNNNGNLSSLSTEQVFSKMKNHRKQRRMSMIPPKKIAPKVDDAQILEVLDYKSDHLISREKKKGTARRNSLDSEKFNSPAVHEKAITNKTLAQVR